MITHVDALFAYTLHSYRFGALEFVCGVDGIPYLAEYHGRDGHSPRYHYTPLCKGGRLVGVQKELSVENRIEFENYCHAWHKMRMNLLSKAGMGFMDYYNWHRIDGKRGAHHEHAQI